MLVSQAARIDSCKSGSQITMWPPARDGLLDGWTVNKGNKVKQTVEINRGWFHEIK
jgi:hypothetical protein